MAWVEARPASKLERRCDWVITETCSRLICSIRLRRADSSSACRACKRATAASTPETADRPAPGVAETVLADYRTTGLSLAGHPVALLREQLAVFKVQPATVLRGYPAGRLARASGIVTHRQRPETARGVVFVTLEDETGAVNVIVWPALAEAQRRPLLASTLLTVYGVWQREGDVQHLVARHLVDHTALLQGLAVKARNFR